MIFFAVFLAKLKVKRKFGENGVSRSVKGLEAEGYQRIWVYDYINQRAKTKVKSLN